MAARILFAPISIGAGILAGLIGKKAFDQIWGLFDKEEPPHPQHREISLPKMLIALAIEGALFRMTRGALDHWSRRSFARYTGTWPGEEEPEPE